jgi:RNA polymerase sigma-70 factor (ECF subfamily)
MIPEHLLDPGKLGDHVDRLFRAAWAMCGSREEAEDLVQETYLKVLSRPRIVRNDDDIGYLVRVLRNTFISSRRKAESRLTTPMAPEDLDPADLRSPQPQAALESREVFAAIAELPDDYRSALVAVDVVGLSYREAAESLKTKEATITSRLYRARAQVAKRVEQPRT